MIVSRVLIIVIFWIFCCWWWSCSCCDLIEIKKIWIWIVLELCEFFSFDCVVCSARQPLLLLLPLIGPDDLKIENRERERESNYFQSLIKISWRWRWLKINLLDECVSRFRVRQQKINKCQCQWFHPIFCDTFLELISVDWKTEIFRDSQKLKCRSGHKCLLSDTLCTRASGTRILEQSRTKTV